MRGGGTSEYKEELVAKKRESSTVGKDEVGTLTSR
jgi:hypothetical protein